MRIKRTVHVYVAIGIETFAKDFNVTVHESKGISEWDTEVDVEGEEKDLIALNEIAKHYHPTITNPNLK